MIDHAQHARTFTANAERTAWHDDSLWFVRQKRDKATELIPEWEELREQASQIKMHMLSRLDHYLEEFERNATARGIQVHWAEDGNAHNRIVHAILERKGVKKVVKSKSMLTEERHLNPYLAERGMDVIDTDLGERIVQMR
ncbi:MAG: LUD domain-containing protein, partial [Verrucomicrobiota bacterium]